MNRKPSHGRPAKRLDLVSRASAGAVPSVQPFEALESRMMLTIVQPAGQSFLAFEAEDPQATFTDLDGDGFQWTVINGAAAQGASTPASGGAAIQAQRDPSLGAANDEGQVSYPIQLTTGGPYFFYARTKYTSSGGDNSMFLPASAGPINADPPTQQWDNRLDSPGNWHWDNLDVNGASFTYTNPTPGAPTTLKMNIRENGYNVDKIVLSQSAMTPAQLDALLSPGAVVVPGLQANQATVKFIGTPGATSYNILRSTSATGTFTQVGTAAGNATSFVDTTLPANSGGQTFFYTVQPVTAGGPGAQTAPASVVIDQGVEAHYFNDNFWGGGGRSSTKYVAGTNSPVTTFRAGIPDVQTIVPNVDFDWGNGSPDPFIRGDNHSTVFTGKVTIPTVPPENLNTDGTVTVSFIHSSDDDGILFVNGKEVANDMGPPGHGQNPITGTIDLLPGHSYDFIQMQAEQGGGSGVRFHWINPATGASEAVPTQNLSFVSDVPAAPTNVSNGVVSSDFNSTTNGTVKMVTFTFTDNATSEIKFELLRDGVVVADAPMDNNGLDADADPSNGLQVTISDSQPLTGSHTYAVRAVNYDGASTAVAAPSAVTLPADYYPTNGASAHYFNSGTWNGGRIGPSLGGGEDRVLAGQPDYGETVDTVDFNYGTSPVPNVIEDDYFGTVFTGKVTIPQDANGNGTNDETIGVQFVGNTDDHGVYFVNGQLAAISFIPRGQGDYTGAGPLQLKEGQAYDFTIFQVEQGGGAGVHFKWVNPASGLTEVIPTTDLSPRTGAPAAPTGASATGYGDYIRVAYNDNATNEVRYDVERAEVVGGTPGAFSLVGYGAVNMPFFLDRSAELGKSYVYRVTAVNYDGRSAASAVTAAVSRANVDPAPASATSGAGTQTLHVVNLHFTDVAGNDTSYIVQRKLASAPDSAFAPILGSPFNLNAPPFHTFTAAGQVGVTNLTDVDPAITATDPVTYRVIAVNKDGVQSAPLDFTTTILPAFRTTFTNAEFAGAGSEVSRGDNTFDYSWGTGRPDPSVSPDTFHTWVEGIYTAPTAGDYVFHVISDDGQRLFVDGNLVVDNWVLQGDTPKDSPPITLAAGQKVELRYEQFEQGGGATARLEVIPPGATTPIPVVATSGPDLTTPLRAPIQVAATANTLGDGIMVHWVDTTANETGFQVLRATDPAGPFTVLGTAPKDAQYFSDVPAPGTPADPPDRLYFYQVRALNGATQGPLSTATDTGVARGTGTVGGAVNFTDWSDPAVQAQWTVNGAGVATGTTGFVADDADPGTNDTEGQIVLRLADHFVPAQGQTTSAYMNDPRHINGFTASFDFQMNPGSGDPADGFTFILQQNDTTKIGGGGGFLGWQGIPNSFAVKFDIYPGKLNQVGIYHNGLDISDAADDPRNRPVPIALDMEADKHFHVDLKYNDTAKTLTLTLDDIGDATTAPFTTTWVADIPTMVQGATAFVGFTGATGGEDTEMDIFNFSYTPGSNAPATVSAVYVRGSSWLGADADPNTETFKEYLQDKGLGNSTYGYKVFDATGTNNANDILPWTNVDEVVVQFAAPPTGSGIPTNGMIFSGVKLPYTVSSVTQLDPQTFVLHLDKPLGGAGTTASNGDKVRVKIPGGGAGGADFSTVLNVVQGDVNKSTSVLANDYSEVKARFFKNTKSPVTGTNDYDAFHDVDGSGSILANDYSAVKARFFQSLPGGTPAAVVETAAAAVGVTRDLFSSRRILD